MNIVGIVSEYNPFHKGHEYHIAETRAALGDDTAVVCVMSGDFVQRGEAAVFSKYARAEAACLCGADLVIELPLPWALSSAEKFAGGAIGLLGALGATHLSFGSELGNVSVLEELAKCALDPSVTERTKEIMAENGNISYPAAKQLAIKEVVGEKAELLDKPNNILGVEYIKAIYEQRFDICPITVQRYGNDHDKSGSEGPKSASEIRKLIIQDKNWMSAVPEAAARVFTREIEQGRVISDRKNIELAMFSRLRMLSEEDFNTLPDATEGLGNRIFKAVKNETGIDAVLAAAKTKRYTLARIRRMLICACLGIKEGMNDGVPPYARVLAANSKGCSLLREMTDRSAMPIISKPASVRSVSAECTKLFANGASAHDFYVLGYRADGEKKGDMDWKTGPKIV